LEREVSTTLEVETLLERHPAERDVVEGSVGPTLALGHVARKQEPHRHEAQGHDGQHAILQEHTTAGRRRESFNEAYNVNSALRLRNARRASAASLPSWATKASIPSNRLTSLNRLTNATDTDSPYQSPPTSNKWTSRLRLTSPNVGRPPRFIIPPNEP